MLKQYDELEKQISKVAVKDMAKAKELSSQKKELLKSMTAEELQTLLARPYPAQYKALIKKYL